MQRFCIKWFLTLALPLGLLPACGDTGLEDSDHSIYIQTSVQGDEDLFLSPWVFSTKGDSVFFFDRKNGYYASGKPGLSDTLRYTAEKLEDFSSILYWISRNGVKEGIGFEIDDYYRKEGDELMKLPIHVPDSQYYLQVIPIVYFGAQPFYLNDSLVAIPTLFQPKGKLMSSEWLKNAMRHGRLAILNLLDHQIHYPFTLKGEVDYHPMGVFDHPLVTSGGNRVFYGLAYSDKIWTYDYLDDRSGSFELETSGIDLDQFDQSKYRDKEYRLSYYQGNSFATGLWYCDELDVLVRRIKAVQEEKDASGLKNPPYWADVRFEVIDPQTGSLKRTLSLDGKTYSYRSVFILNGAIYVKNDEKSRDTTLVFDGFELD